MKRIFNFIIITYFVQFSFGQNDFDKLPNEIAILLNKNELNKSLIKSVEIQKLDSKSMSKLIDTFGSENYRYIVNYELFNQIKKINFFKYDQTTLVHEYEYCLYTSIKINTEKTLIDQSILIREIQESFNGMNNIIFFDNLSGKYDDETYESKNVQFQLTLELFKGRGFEDKVELYLNFVDINSLVFDKNNFRTFLCLRSRDMSQFRNGKIDLRLKRYRQLLFNPIDGKLLSDGVVSPVVWLLE